MTMTMFCGTTPYYNDLRKANIPQLEKLHGCSILVTGATGLIGSALVDLLMLHAEEQDLTVYAGCRSREKFEARFANASKRLRRINVDVTKSIDSDVRFDYIVHAASGAAPCDFAENSVGVMLANITGTANLLDYGIAHGMKRMLYISSGEVYGEGCKGQWNEADSGYVDTMSPRACYPSAKRAAETLCAAYAKQYGVEAVVARLCHTYGPCFTARDNRVYAQFIRNVLHDEDIVLKSAGAQYRSWLYVADCAAALLHILVSGTSGEAYNVADENSCITIRELAETVATIAGRKVRLELPKEHDAQTSAPITKAIFNTNKLRSLGWKPMFSIKEGLTHTIMTLKEK